MKLRQGFVSNSSSSSFVVDRRYVSEMQEYALFHMLDFIKTDEFFDLADKYVEENIDYEENLKEEREYYRNNVIELCNYIEIEPNCWEFNIINNKIVARTEMTNVNLGLYCKIIKLTNFNFRGD